MKASTNQDIQMIEGEIWDHCSILNVSKLKNPLEEPLFRDFALKIQQFKRIAWIH